VIKVDTDDASYMIISLGEPDPNASGRIVAIDLGVLEWLDRRLAVLARFRQRAGNCPQEGVTLFGPDQDGGFHQGA
jgi:hypothetical protein